ncbi:MAG: hypothetical protein V1890_04465, partial [Candidatus Zixiibacteriota bacterium]
MFKNVIISGVIFFFILTSCLFAQTIVKDDFRVNDDYDIGGSNQRMPAIAMDHQGNFVVVWVDERNTFWDIYGQRFDRSGNPLGGNFRVNDGRGENKSYNHNFGVAMDADGDFVVVWQDNRSNNSDIYAQRYNSSGLQVGSNFKVNDDPGFSSQTSPAVTMNPSGEFVAVWLDNRDRNFSIYGQRYLSSGEAMGTNFKITSFQMSKIDLFPPGVAIDPKGDFVVTWSAVVYNPETSKDYHEIHAIRVNAKNEILGSEFKVNDSDSSASPSNPDIAMDAPGNFVITWVEKKPSSLDILAQRYNLKGEPIGDNFKVNESTGRAYKNFPSVTMNLSKGFVIAWIELRDMINIYLQYYNQHGEPEGNNFKVVGFFETWGPSNIDISKTPSDYLALVWDGYICKSDNNIFAMIMNQKREVVKEGFRVSNDLGSSSQKNPAIATSPSGKFAISWDDLRFCSLDIFTQRFNSFGEFLGPNFKVNPDSGEIRVGYQSSISMDSAGNYAITFLSGGNVYLQRYDLKGDKLGQNIMVNEMPWLFLAYNPDLAMDAKGDMMVVWAQTPYSDRLIFAQLYDSQGSKIDTNFMVNSFVGSNSSSDFPKVAKSPDGNFVVVWENYNRSSNESEIWGQLFDRFGKRIGENFKISDAAVSMWNSLPDVGMDKDGNFVVAWSIGRNILIQRYKADGSKIGEVIEAIGHVKTKTDKISLAVKSSGEFIVAWSDFRNVNGDIYAQRFDAEGNRLGGNFRVNSDEGDYIQQSPVVATDDKNYYFSWVDNRFTGSGFDIFGKIISFDQTFVSEQEALNKPELALLQNYPNPFNPATTIPFCLKAQSARGGSTFKGPIHTTLTIYNLLGQKVKTLVEEDKLPDNYQVIWDG